MRLSVSAVGRDPDAHATAALRMESGLRSEATGWDLGTRPQPGCGMWACEVDSYGRVAGGSVVEFARSDRTGRRPRNFPQPLRAASPRPQPTPRARSAATGTNATSGQFETMPPAPSPSLSLRAALVLLAVGVGSRCRRPPAPGSAADRAALGLAARPRATPSSSGSTRRRSSGAPGTAASTWPGGSGSAVHAVADGVVTFAGVLAGRGVVVVSHGGLRSTYEPVSAAVARGDAVSAGQVHRGAAGSPVTLPAGRLPAPRRQAGPRYIDPEPLLGSQEIRLKPLAGLPPTVVSPEPIDLRRPLAAQRSAAALPVTSGFGPRIHPLTGQSSIHDGVDYGVGCGTPIAAAADGTVLRAGADPVYGHQIIVEHGDGLETRYGHMYADGVLVAVGDSVRAGADHRHCRLGRLVDRLPPPLHRRQPWPARRPARVRALTPSTCSGGQVRGQARGWACA